MAEYVLDASALLAFLRNEPGAERVSMVLTRTCISSVNMAETLGKMVEYGKALEATVTQIERLRIPVVAFDAAQATLTASLWKETRSAGLSLGDRACLALSLQRSLPALTTETRWEGCCTGVRIENIRPK